MSSGSKTLPRRFEDVGQHTNIPDGLTVMSGFRWRLPHHTRWHYVFGRSPDSWELRECMLESVEISKGASTTTERAEHE